MITSTFLPCKVRLSAMYDNQQRVFKKGALLHEDNLYLIQWRAIQTALLAVYEAK